MMRYRLTLSSQPEAPDYNGAHIPQAFISQPVIMAILFTFTEIVSPALKSLAEIGWAFSLACSSHKPSELSREQVFLSVWACCTFRNSFVAHLCIWDSGSFHVTYSLYHIRKVLFYIFEQIWILLCWMFSELKCKKQCLCFTSIFLKYLCTVQRKDFRISLIIHLLILDIEIDVDHCNGFREVDSDGESVSE